MNFKFRNLFLIFIVVGIVFASGCIDSKNSYNVFNSKFKLGSEWELDISNDSMESNPKIFYTSFNFTGSKTGKLIVSQYLDKQLFHQDYENKLYIADHLNWTIAKNKTIKGVPVKILEDRVVSGLGRTITYFFIKKGKYYSVLILSQDPYDETFQKSIETIISTLE